MNKPRPIWKSPATRIAVIACLGMLLGVRFIHLRADFPNHTYWSDDHAKYSDEGWYANAAMNSVLLGHWYLPGDWAPAAVVPAWPALLTAEFHITGVSVVAARATEVCFSIAALLLCAWIFRRYSSRESAMLLLIFGACSASGYIYSRIAILERPFEFMAVLCLWIALGLTGESVLAAIALGFAIVVMVLTKTTAVFLVPAILYPVAFRYRSHWRTMVRPLLIVFITAGVLMAAERIFFASHHLADIRAFFGNSEPHLALYESARKAVRLLYRGTWIDPFLWPLAVFALVASLWMRELWNQVLWGVCALWIVGYSAFIVYHYDGPPRYFTMMTLPTFMLVIMFATAALRRSRSLAALVAVVCAFSVGWNLVHVVRWATHPEYTMASAADTIRQIIDAHPESPRLIIGHASNQTTLFTGIPSMDDTLGSAGEAQKMQMYNPGWVLIWTDESDSDLSDIARVRTLEPMVELPALDDPVRGHLVLYQLKPLP